MRKMISNVVAALFAGLSIPGVVMLADVMTGRFGQ